MKNFSKILLPLLFCSSAFSNEISNEYLARMAQHAQASYSQNSIRDALKIEHEGLGNVFTDFSYRRKNSIDGHAGTISLFRNITGSTEITIAFRGTESLADWTEANFNSVMGHSLEKNGEIFGNLSGRVHAGFLSRYQDCREDLLKQIRSLLENHGLESNNVTFNITGHSLGGALASIAAVDLRHALTIDKEHLKLTTFASPRVYNKKAAAAIDNLFGDNAVRVWMENDIVPAANLGLIGYKHIGQSLKLRSTTNIIQLSDISGLWSYGLSFFRGSTQAVAVSSPLGIATNMVAGNTVEALVGGATLCATEAGLLPIATAVPIATIAAVGVKIGERYITEEHSIESLKEVLHKGAKPIQHTPLWGRIKKMFGMNS